MDMLLSGYFEVRTRIALKVGRSDGKECDELWFGLCAQRHRFLRDQGVLGRRGDTFLVRCGRFVKKGGRWRVVWTRIVLKVGRSDGKGCVEL